MKHREAEGGGGAWHGVGGWGGGLRSNPMHIIFSNEEGDGRGGEEEQEELMYEGKEK